VSIIREVTSLHYAIFKKDHCRDLTVPLTKTFGLGFENIKVNVQNVISCLIQLSLVI
jgi:hypothetical protein